MADMMKTRNASIVCSSPALAARHTEDRSRNFAVAAPQVSSPRPGPTTKSEVLVLKRNLERAPQRADIGKARPGFIDSIRIEWHED
eukprot:4218362-Pyramimonas_sp.AAC.1